MYSTKIEIHIYLRDAWAQRFGFYWIEALHTFTFAFPTAKFKAVQRALETLNNFSVSLFFFVGVVLHWAFPHNRLIYAEARIFHLPWSFSLIQ